MDDKQPQNQSNPPTPGTVIKGGFTPPEQPEQSVSEVSLPAAAPTDTLPPSFTSPTDNIGSANSSGSSLSSVPYLRLLPLLIVVLLLIGGSSIVLSKTAKSVRPLATTTAPKKTQPTSTQKQSTPTDSTPAAPPASTPAPAPAAPTSSHLAPSGATPSSPLTGTGKTISLTNQDNGRSVTVPAGATLSVYLTGAAGYHWSIQARSSNPRLFSPSGPVVHGTDGSITEKRIATLLGTVTIGYTDYPDCYPTSCTQEQPRDQWSAVITVVQ